MRASRITSVLLLALGASAGAQHHDQEAMPGITDAYYGSFDDDNPYATAAMLDHIRREKFDLRTPSCLMRKHGVDMWIHVIRPVDLERQRAPAPWKGSTSTTAASTASTRSATSSAATPRFSSSPTAAATGSSAWCSRAKWRTAAAYDIVQPAVAFHQPGELRGHGRGREPTPTEVPESEIGYRFMGLGAFVAERDPGAHRASTTRRSSPSPKARRPSPWRSPMASPSPITCACPRSWGRRIRRADGLRRAHDHRLPEHAT